MSLKARPGRAVPGRRSVGRIGWVVHALSTYVHGVDVVGEDLVEGLERPLVAGRHLLSRVWWSGAHPLSSAAIIHPTTPSSAHREQLSSFTLS